MNEALGKRIEEWESDGGGCHEYEHCSALTLVDCLIAALREAEEVAEGLEKDKAALVGALRDGTKDALDVAAAVTWCEKNANLVEYRPLKGWLVDDGWHNEMQAGLPAAVAALRQRVEGE